MCDHVHNFHDHHVLQSGWVGGRCTPSALFVALELYGKNILDNTKHNITQLEETHFLYLLALCYVYMVVQENMNILFPPYKGSLEIWWGRGEGVLKAKIIKGKYEAKLENPMCDFKIRWYEITSMNWNFQRGRGSTTLSFQCAKINRIQKLTFLPLPSFCLVLLLSTNKQHVYNFKRKSNKTRFTQVHFPS